MNISSFKKPSLFFCLVLFCFTCLFIPDATGDKKTIIGIVLSVEGGIQQQAAGNTTTLSPGNEILPTGTLVLGKDRKKGKILIGTDKGPVLFTRFPLKIGEKVNSILSDDLISSYLDCIGGKVLGTKGLKNVKKPADLLKEMIECLTEKQGSSPDVVALGNFVYADKGIGSEFSAFLENQIAIAIAGSDKYELFARSQLEEILEMQELSLSDLFAANDMQAGALKNIDSLLFGQFFDDAREVLVFLNLADIETGLIKGTISFPLDKTLIPSSISILPANAEGALEVIDDLAQIGKSGDESLVIRAWHSRGEGGTYYEGDDLVVRFQSEKDCFIKIYHIDVDRKISLIFPNKFHKDNKIKKGMVYLIPDDSYNFSFVLGKPFGTEFIKVIASTSQFKDIEEAFTALGDGNAEIIDRGLTVEQKENKLAEVLFSYTILEKAE